MEERMIKDMVTSCSKVWRKRYLREKGIDDMALHLAAGIM
jgi:hypothetical protein